MARPTLESPGLVLLDPAPMKLLVTPSGYRVACYAVALEQFPADFFADPDGRWTYEGLAEAAGFALDQGVAVGVLARDHFGHPEGSAVVTLDGNATVALGGVGALQSLGAASGSSKPART